MAAGLTTKSVKDGAGNPFDALFYDDGNSRLAPVGAAPAIASAPVAGASSLQVRTGAGRHVESQASNSSQTEVGFLIAADLAAIPASGAAFASGTVKKFARLPMNDGSTDGTAEIDTVFAVTNGLVLLLSKSLTSYVPGTLTGQMNSSYL